MRTRRLWSVISIILVVTFVIPGLYWRFGFWDLAEIPDDPRLPEKVNRIREIIQNQNPCETLISFYRKLGRPDFDSDRRNEYWDFPGSGKLVLGGGGPVFVTSDKQMIYLLLTHNRLGDNLANTFYVRSLKGQSSRFKNLTTARGKVVVDPDGGYQWIPDISHGITDFPDLFFNNLSVD